MAKITALFWDNGGVLLTNGWDRDARKRAVEKFQLDWADFEDRHELVLDAFETGVLSLDDYSKPRSQGAQHPQRRNFSAKRSARLLTGRPRHSKLSSR